MHERYNARRICRMSCTQKSAKEADKVYNLPGDDVEEDVSMGRRPDSSKKRARYCPRKIFSGEDAALSDGLIGAQTETLQEEEDAHEPKSHSSSVI